MHFSGNKFVFAYKTDADIKRGICLFSIFKKTQIESFFQFLLKTAIKLRLPTDWVVRPTVYAQFCAGESLEDGYAVVKKLNKWNLGAVLDYSAESGKGAADYDAKLIGTDASTDAAYDDALKIMVKNRDVISLINATHNEKSNYLLAKLMRINKLENMNKRYYFAQLYGMSDHISFNLAKEGYNVVKYIPYGALRKLIPYLLRRAEENSAVADQAEIELRMLKKEMKRRKTT